MDLSKRQSILDEPALQAPDNVIPDFQNPPNNTALVNGVFFACLILTTLVLLTRVHSWLFLQKTLTSRFEAVLVIAGFASYLGFISLVLKISYTSFGWFVHQWDVHVRDTIPFSYDVYVAGILYNSAIAPVKVAILIEWMRIFAPRTRNVFWWTCQTVLWINVLYYTAATIVEVRQCTPQARIWDPTITEGSCLDTRAVEVTSASLNIICDFVIFLAPQHVIWRLQMKLRIKAGVALMFAIGLFGCICAIFRLVVTEAYLKSDDSTYSVTPVALWALGEMTSVFFIYSMPAVPAAVGGAATSVRSYYALFTTRTTSARSGNIISGVSDASAATSAGRGGTRVTAGRRYANLDKNSLPLNSIDIKAAHWEEAEVAPRPARGGGVVRTVEFQSEETPIPAGTDTSSTGDAVLLLQHPWVGEAK